MLARARVARAKVGVGACLPNVPATMRIATLQGLRERCSRTEPRPGTSERSRRHVDLETQRLLKATLTELVVSETSGDALPQKMGEPSNKSMNQMKRARRAANDGLRR